MVLFIYSVVQGIVQGITELLPISSTAHMILVDKLIKFQVSERFTDMFEVVVQLGSILAFLVYFHEKLLPVAALKDKNEFKKMFSIWLKSVIGVIPACIVGLLFGSYIQQTLQDSALVIASALFAGGILLFLLDRTYKTAPINEIGKLPYWKAVMIGCAQCIAMLPGVSRSAATIMGGLLCGATRSVAVEYSFFLAIPTMVAASGYSLLKHGAVLSVQEWLAVALGFVVSFFVSWGVVIFFMNYIKTRNFRIFAFYRIILGLVLALLIMKGFIK